MDSSLRTVAILLMVAGGAAEALAADPVTARRWVSNDNASMSTAKAGSKFFLATPLSFAPGSREILFQNEQVVPAGKLSRNMPYCKLTSDSGATTPIAPGAFTVGAVNYDEREIGTTSGMVSVTRIALSADPSQAGYTLVCGWPPGAAPGGFVSTEQIYNAIGGKYFTMNLLR